MVTRKPYHTRPYRLTSLIAGCAAALLSAGIAYKAPGWLMQRHTASLPVSSGNAPLISAARPETPPKPVEPNIPTPIADDKDAFLPRLLSGMDAQLYRKLFQAQRQKDWATADATIAQIHNPMLLGHALAMRYQDSRYNATPPQLANWLNRYSDLPEASDIYTLAVTVAPALKSELPELHKPASLSGYGDNTLVTAQGEPSAAYLRMWNNGLNAWRLGHKAEAAKFFSAIVQHADAQQAPVTPAAYWAYRAYKAMGNKPQADLYLHIAANEPRNFYGILARRQLKQSLTLDTSPITLSDSDILELISNAAVRRCIALAQIGETDMAEQELRTEFTQVALPEKFRMLALARQLNLASVQIGMARLLGHDGQELDLARYPIPHWRPAGGFTIDPALIFALMRQESGFHASAVSTGGALGVMQLMPQTASLMRKTLGYDSGNMAEPVLNMTLGQSYVSHLLESEPVQGNLFYLLAAYNAGPGRLQEWKDSMHKNDDPLLFLESIPYGQTRHYIMQVMANYWIYSELNGTANYSVYALINNRWPSYDGYVAPVAESKTAENMGS